MKRGTTKSLLHKRALGWAGLVSAVLALAPATQAQTVPALPPAAALGQPASAPTGPWTLQRAIDYALQNNLAVRQSELTAQQQEASQRLNRAALLPTAGFNGTQGFNFGTNRDPFTNQFQQLNVRSNNFTASGQLTLFSGFQLRNTIRQGQLDAHASRVDI